MQHDFHQLNVHEHDECISRGLCARSPILTSLHEVIMLNLRELSFYLLKLKEQGARNHKLNEQVVEMLSSLIVNVEYTPEQFKTILDRLHEGIVQARGLYTEMCKNNAVGDASLVKAVKKERKFNFAAVIRDGQREAKKQIKSYTVEERRTVEALFILIKSICINLVALRSYGVEHAETYYYVLELLDSMTNPQAFAQKKEEQMERFVGIDSSLLKQLYELKKERFGEIVPVNVSFSTRPNKSILVTGSNLVDLEALLQATAGRGIDVYTHGEMIMAHAYPKLNAYPHLVGHFGKGIEMGLVDFAAFPGAIFMTRLSLQRVDRLYRSRIFTTDTIATKGVTIIRDGNYEPLVESALSAKGFEHTREKWSVAVGFCEKEVLAKITEVAEKMEKNEIKHFFTIGVANGTNVQREYFEKFLSLVPDDCFVLSFSYSHNNEAKNILFIPSDTEFPIIYKALDLLSKKTKLSDMNISILFTRCEYHTVSNLLNIAYMGVRDVYFPSCSPNLIRPEVIDGLREKHQINSYSSPKVDLQRMLSVDKGTN